jgi:hypothetical protein
MTVLIIAIVALLSYLFSILQTAGASLAQQTSNSASNAKPIQTSAGSMCLYASDSSLTGAPITVDQSTWPGASPQYPSEGTWNICAAIARAEGYPQGYGAAPFDLNNPGDLSPGDENGEPTGGPAEFHGGSNIICFKTVEAGFIALYKKFQNIVNGNSNVYPVSAPWSEVAVTYAGNSSAWLNNVTNYLGVDASTTPAQYVASIDNAGATSNTSPTGNVVSEASAISDLTNLFLGGGA